MQTYTLFEGYTGHSEGIGVAQVLLRSEGNLAQVGKALDVLGFEPNLLKAFFVEGRVHAMAHGFLQTLQLECLNLLARHRFELRIKEIRLFHNYVIIVYDYR